MESKAQPTSTTRPWHFFGIAKTEWKASKPSEASLYAEQLRIQLEIFANSEQPDKQEWLRTFYNRYTDRFTKDNEKIWSTAAIFIPLSLVGLSYFSKASLVGTILIALGSIRLMQFWVNVAENHRAFQQKSQVIATAIEQYVGLNFSHFEVEKDGKKVLQTDMQKLDSHGELKHNVQLARWKMLYSVRIIWWAAIISSLVRISCKTFEAYHTSNAAASTPVKTTTVGPYTTTTTTTTVSEHKDEPSLIDLIF